MSLKNNLLIISILTPILSYAQAQFIGVWKQVQSSNTYLYIEDKNSCYTETQLHTNKKDCHWNMVMGDIELYFYDTGEANVYSYNADTDAMLFRDKTVYMRQEDSENLMCFIGSWIDKKGNVILVNEDFSCTITQQSQTYKNCKWTANYEVINFVLDGTQISYEHTKDTKGKQILNCFSNNISTIFSNSYSKK